LVPNDIKIRPINKSDWEREVRSVVSIFNESLARLWGNVPFDPDEFIEFANEFKSLILPEFWMIAETGGKAVGFVGSFPQYSAVFKDLDGKIKPQSLIKLPLQMRAIREGVIMIVGLLDEYKGRNLGKVLLGRACDVMVEKGYDKAIPTWALEDNLKSRRILEDLGGKVDIHWEMYSKTPALSE
jgi:GNAT superfamily N-acetyltransferase